MKKSEYERLRNIALEKLSQNNVSLSEYHMDKNVDELAQINEIYQAELEAQNDELQTHIFRLEEAQSELEILFNNAPIPYVLLTSEFMILRANTEVLKMFNLNNKTSFYINIHKGYLKIFLDWINYEDKEEAPLEILLKTKKGSRYCSLHYHKWSENDTKVFLLSIIDIHTQREENDRFKALFESSQQGVIYLDKHQEIVKLNQTAIDIIGEEDQCISKKYTDLNWTFLDENDETIPVEKLPFDKVFKTKKAQEASIFAIYQPVSMSKLWLRMEAIPHSSVDSEELMGVFCIFSDVTHEYILNKELHKQLENFKTLGNNIPDVIMRINSKQSILFMNKKANEFFKIQTTQENDIKLCDLAIFKTQQAKNACQILEDLEGLKNPLTYSLTYKTNSKNKNYFIRIIPEKLETIEKTFLVVIEDITERVESEDMFNQLFYHASDAIILTDHNNGKLRSINSKARKLLDFDKNDLESYSSSDVFESFKCEDEYTQHIEALDSCGVDSYETTRTLENGDMQYLKIYCTLIDVGEDTYHQSIVHDLTEHKLLELQLQQTSKVFEHTTEGILITSLDGTIVSVNEAFTKISGYTKEEVIGKNPSILKSGRQDKSYYKRMWNDILKNGLFKGEIWNKKKNGTIYPEWLAISPIYDENSKPIQYVAVFSDFSEIKKAQNKLKNLAHYDTLTKLPNRLLLHEQIKQSIKSTKRNKNKFAVLFIDLDRFKQINDTYGHDVGDEVLKMTATRLQSVLRESDIVSRLGGDEFIAVINDIDHIQNIHLVVQNILDKLQTPFSIEEHEHFTSGSIGISVYPDDTQDDDIDILLKHADIAMYESKTAGRNNYHMFSSSMAETVKNLSSLHNNLNVALNNDEFYLVYQPQYDVIKDKLVGFEALIRWKHPINGEIGPDAFIPYTEESKLIIPIGKWVIEQAIEDYYKMKELLDSDFTISVNVSHVQINQEFVNTLKYLISKHDNFANIIKIEITETSAMHNLENTQNIIGQIKDLGFKISLDDFGTGYSALNAIKTLRVDEIKIDRSFIKDVPGDKDDEELVSTIIAMAKVMKKSVVAEGVERSETRDFLIERRCPIIQGYFISKPMTLKDTLAFIEVNFYKD